MVLEGRQKEIFDILYEKGRVSVTELSRTLFVSEMTIRRDLSEMEKSGVLKRYRGGAVLGVEGNELPISQRFFMEEKEKKNLAQFAEKHLRDNTVVYIDSSSTCQYLIPHFTKFKNITIITNSVKALLSASKLHIPCILIGGEYYEQDMCLVGSIAEDFANNFNVDIAFFTTQGLSDDGTMSDSDLRQTMIRKVVMKNAKENIFLFEKNKLGKKYTYTLCIKEDATRVIVCD